MRKSTRRPEYRSHVCTRAPRAGDLSLGVRLVAQTRWTEVGVRLPLGRREPSSCASRVERPHIQVLHPVRPCRAGVDVDSMLRGSLGEDHSDAQSGILRTAIRARELLVVARRQGGQMVQVFARQRRVRAPRGAGVGGIAWKSEHGGNMSILLNHAAGTSSVQRRITGLKGRAPLRVGSGRPTGRHVWELGRSCCPDSEPRGLWRSQQA